MVGVLAAGGAAGAVGSPATVGSGVGSGAGSVTAGAGAGGSGTVTGGGAGCVGAGGMTTGGGGWTGGVGSTGVTTGGGGVRSPSASPIQTRFAFADVPCAALVLATLNRRRTVIAPLPSVSVRSGRAVASVPWAVRSAVSVPE